MTGRLAGRAGRVPGVAGGRVPRTVDRDERTSEKQLEWRERLTAAGHCVAECRSCEEAMAVIERYLG